MNIHSFSVLMSVYKNDQPQFLREALDSILINQSVKPNQVVLVKDGPTCEGLNSVIDYYVLKFPDIFNVVVLTKNKGLGEALNKGLKHCKFKLVARMDSDDISHPLRFEEQVKFLIQNEDIDVVGSSVEEFNKEPGDLKRFRTPPTDGDSLRRYSKFRSPLNHPTIMFRKESVLSAGGYNGDIRLFEDFSLFIRMIQNGSKFYNLQTPLLHFRIGNGLDSIKRRRGSNYVKSEIKYLRLAHEIGHLNKMDVLLYAFLKFPIRFLPSKSVMYFYRFVLRSKK